MGKKKRMMARARLSMAGTDHYYQEFTTTRSPNGLSVVIGLIQQFRNAFLNAILGGHSDQMQKRAGQFNYLVALVMLARLNGEVDKRQFWRDLKQVKLPLYGTDTPLPDDALLRSFEIEETTP
jgi:hypothetical protein